jgi:TetR/AcrR family transcriptional repressor of nem operon
MTDDAVRPLRAARGTARARLLDAAVALIRQRGLTATSVDDLCTAAGVTKGAFFHHFPSKEALAVAAAHHWAETTGALFAAAPYHAPESAVDRVLAYVDFRRELGVGDPAEFSCLAGTMVQECFATHPEIRDACGEVICGHARTLEADIAAALPAHGPGAAIAADDLARFTQVVLQGAFVVAKAADDPDIVTQSLDHLRRYLEHVFDVAR